MSRDGKSSTGTARDAMAILNFEPQRLRTIDGIEGCWVPMTFIRRAKRVAASALSQAADGLEIKPTRSPRRR